MAGESIYTIQATPKSHCGQCEGPLDLLCPANPTRKIDPFFYICWNCRNVSQAGRGVVERDLS